MDEVECIVVGAGVVGLAIARRLAQDGREVIVIEAEDAIGTQTSSRNSEVIHAGIYYKAGSLMAQFCVAGKRALYNYCRDHGVDQRNCGKLIVATTPHESEKLAAIRAHAAANGVDDLTALSRRGSAHAGAGAGLRRGFAIAVHRHHRQSRLHAGAARRCRGRWRGVRVSRAVAAGQARHGWFRGRGRRRCADETTLSATRECGGIGRHRRRARHRCDVPGRTFHRLIWPRETTSVAAPKRRSRG